MLLLKYNIPPISALQAALVEHPKQHAPLCVLVTSPPLFQTNLYTINSTFGYMELPISARHSNCGGELRGPHDGGGLAGDAERERDGPLSLAVSNALSRLLLKFSYSLTKHIIYPARKCRRGMSKSAPWLLIGGKHAAC